MTLGNIKSVEMAEFFTMLHAQRPVKQATVDTERINVLYREIEALQAYLDDDDISYFDRVEANNDITACRQEIARLQNPVTVAADEKKMSNAITRYQQTITEAAQIKAAQKISRLNSSRDRIKSEYEKTHVIGLTDTDAKKCNRLLAQYQQIKNAIRAASNQNVK